MSDATQLLRQWQLLRMLSVRRAGLTLRQMASDTGRSQKTIRRDLEVLQQVGFPLTERVSDHGRKHWRLVGPSGVAGQNGNGHAPTNGWPSLSFNLDEAIALYLGRQLLEPLAGTCFWEGARSAFRKIQAGLGEQTLAYLEQFRSTFLATHFGHGDCSDRGPLLDALLTGIEDRRTARLLYRSSRLDVPEPTDVHPYGLVWHRGNLYLVAHSPQHEELRHYKVDRVRDVEILRDASFERPADFDLQQHLQGTLGVFHSDGPPKRVRIRFAPAAARYVQERHWHATQRLTPHTDGSLTLELELTELTEVKSWALSFGSQAVVEAPEELRREIRADLRSMLVDYRDSPNS
ncbi:MAG: WYL domain-containing transcriptional regulator [Planctomyces sp.]|nr:WYL domain-containing transcriptional regulator [Planctomyces sp.]